MPIPIVAISAGIAHEQYGINDRYVYNKFYYSLLKKAMKKISCVNYVSIYIYIADVGYPKRKVLFGDLLVQCF